MKFAVTLNALVLGAFTTIGVMQFEQVRATERVSAIPEEEFHCLQQNVYFEARNQSVLGQTAVAWVTLNRVQSERYPDTICEVVWQRSQFSWTSDGKPDVPPSNVVEQQAWHQAGIVAEVVLIDLALDEKSPIGQATMFHADYVDPYWSDSYDRVAQIDDHIFYESM